MKRHALLIAGGLVLGMAGVVIAFATPINGEQACPGGGKVTWSGNITRNANGSVSGSIDYQYGNPALNGTDDCIVGGRVLSGTVHKTMSGSAYGPSWNADGVVGWYEQTPSGGLKLLSNCRVFVGSLGGFPPTGESCGLDWPLPPPGNGDDDDDGSSFVITSTSIPSGDTMSGLPYLEYVDATGGEPPCTWDITGLPSGFTVQTVVDVGSNEVVCDTVGISGNAFNQPGLIGSYPITVHGQDDVGNEASKDFVLVIVE